MSGVNIFLPHWELKRKRSVYNVSICVYIVSIMRLYMNSGRPCQITYNRYGNVIFHGSQRGFSDRRCFEKYLFLMWKGNRTRAFCVMEVVNKIFPPRVRKQKYSPHKLYHLQVQGPGWRDGNILWWQWNTMPRFYSLKLALVLGRHYQIKWPEHWYYRCFSQCYREAKHLCGTYFHIC